MRKLVTLVLFSFTTLAVLGGPQTETPSEIPESIPVMAKEGAKLFDSFLEKANVLTPVKAGTVLSATDARGLLLQVEYEGQKGWVHVSTLRFQKGAKEFIDHRNKLAIEMAKVEEEKFKNTRSKESMRSKRNARAKENPLQQCAHVKPNGQQCMYQTADPSGNCPEHQN